MSFENLRVYKVSGQLVCELQVPCDLDYIKEEQLDALRPQFTDVAKMLSGLRNSLNDNL